MGKKSKFKKPKLEVQATAPAQTITPVIPQDRGGGKGYLVAALLLPFLVLWRQDNALFTGFGYVEPWVYFGYFRNLVEFKRTLFAGEPHGNHLSWILPGAALHRLFNPVTATYLLHLGVHTLATTSLFLTLKWLTDARRAFVIAMVFCVNAWLWASTGWDYVDGIGIAYCLLTMALLTWAALIPARRWALVAAGMSLAALLDTGAGWLTLAPLLPLYYAGLTWTWHRISISRSFLVLFGWFGGGGVAMATVFYALNYFLDGKDFRSLIFPHLRLSIAIIVMGIAAVVVFRRRPEIGRAIPGRALFSILLILCGVAWAGLLLSTRGGNSPGEWKQGLWRDDGPSPWLLFPIVAAVTALVVLYSERRQLRSRISVPALLSLQLLFALAWMTYAQLRGHPELGAFYSASKLLPFSFLVIGARFWPEAQKVRFPDYLIFCSIGAIALGYAWVDEGMTLVGGLPYASWLGACALLVPLFWIRFPEYLICFLGGFFVLTAVGAGSRYGGIDAHTFRDHLQTLSTARERIEIVRQRSPVLFWFDDKDPAMPDALALNATYLGGHSRLSTSIETAPCNQDLIPSSVVAAIAANPLNRPDFAAAALSPCWTAKGLRATPIEVNTYRNGASGGYVMSLLRIEAAGSAPP